MLAKGPRGNTQEHAVTKPQSHKMNTSRVPGVASRAEAASFDGHEHKTSYGLYEKPNNGSSHFHRPVDS